MQTGVQTKPSLRALRPLYYWLILLLVLFLVHTHQRLSEQTRLLFSTSLDGKPVLGGLTARFDTIPISSGDRVRVGWHTLSIAHSKTETFSTNLFIWYGSHDFGNIDLKRTKGVLAVVAAPIAPLLIINGPEWSATLSNSTGVTETVPTDEYTVTARYRHFEQSQRIQVLANISNPLKIAPRLGSLELSCNQPATFRLLRLNDDVVEQGTFPAVITHLMEGKYKLLAQHHDHQRTEMPLVTALATNRTKVEFRYGAALVESTPAGALATTADGHEWGKTPLTLTELEPGRWNFILQLDNFEPTTAQIDVVADETNAVYTHLVRR